MRYIIGQNAGSVKREKQRGDANHTRPYQKALRMEGKTGTPFLFSHGAHGGSKDRSVFIPAGFQEGDGEPAFDTKEGSP